MTIKFRQRLSSGFRLMWCTCGRDGEAHTAHTAESRSSISLRTSRNALAECGCCRAGASPCRHPGFVVPDILRAWLRSAQVLPQNTAFLDLAWNSVSHSGQTRVGLRARVAALRFSCDEAMHSFEQKGAFGEPNLAPLGASFPHSPHTFTATPCILAFCRSAQHLFEQKNSVCPRARCFVT
jgi:hypothetical protein